MKHRGGYQKRNAAEPETVMDEAQRNAAEQMLKDLGAGPEDEAPAEETAEAAVSAEETAEGSVSAEETAEGS
nr:hypothetical protein [Lachnospiraceae bacterium]